MELNKILEAAGIDPSIEIDNGGHYDFLCGETIEYCYLLDSEGNKVGDLDDAGNVRLDGKHIGTVTE